MAYNAVGNATNRTFERTLTYDKYTDPKELEKEMDLVFSKSWQLVGHVSQLEEANMSTLKGPTPVRTRGT